MRSTSSPAARGHDHDHGGPGRQQQSRLDVVVAAGLLQVEGQRHHGEHLPEERADRRCDRDREDRDAQQVERQDRIRFAQLAADEEEADDDERRDAQREHARVQPVGETLDRGHHQSERQGVHHCVAPVEAVFAHPYGILRQEPAAERQGGQPYRDVHGEQPRPVGRGEDAAASVGPATDEVATTVALTPMPRPSRALG